MTFECQRCGWCCENVNINISYSDILRWVKEKRFDILGEISYIEHEDSKKRGFYIIKTVEAPKQSCPFLKDSLCTIHNTLPRACKEFPIAHNDDEKLKIECPARDGFQSDKDEVLKLKKEQAFDFQIAEDRKDTLLHYLTLVRTVQAGMAELKEFGDDPTETLKATTLGTERTAWTAVGTLHLQEQDQPTHYVWTATKKAEHGDWDFANTVYSAETFNSATLYIYSQNPNLRDLSAFIWDGSIWTEYVMTHPATWGWHSLAVPVINSWTKVDGAQLYIKQPNQTDRSDVDAAYLLIDYTEAGAVEEVMLID